MTRAMTEKICIDHYAMPVPNLVPSNKEFGLLTLIHGGAPNAVVF